MSVDGISLRSISDLADAQTKVQVPGATHTHTHTKSSRTLAIGSSSIGSAVDSAKSSSSSSGKGSAAVSQSASMDIYTEYHRRADIAYSAVMHREVGHLVESAHEECTGGGVRVFSSDSESTHPESTDPRSTSVCVEHSVKMLSVDSDVHNIDNRDIGSFEETGSIVHSSDVSIIDLGSAGIRREVAVILNALIDDIIAGNEDEYAAPGSSISTSNAEKESDSNTGAINGIPNICHSPLMSIEIESVTVSDLECVIVSTLETEECVDHRTVPKTSTVQPTISTSHNNNTNNDNAIALFTSALPSTASLSPSTTNTEDMHSNPTCYTHITPHPHPIEPHTLSQTLAALDGTHVQSVLTIPALSAAVKAALVALVEGDRGKGDVVCLDYMYLRHECGLDIGTSPSQQVRASECPIPGTVTHLHDDSVMHTCASEGEVVGPESTSDLLNDAVCTITQSENEAEIAKSECMSVPEDANTIASNALEGPSKTDSQIDEKNVEKGRSTNKSEEGKANETNAPMEYVRNLKRSRVPTKEEHVGVACSDSDCIGSHDTDMPTHASTYTSGRMFVLNSGKSVIARVGNSISKLAAYPDTTQQQTSLTTPRPLPSTDENQGRDKVKNGDKEKSKLVQVSQRESEKHSKFSRKRKKGKQVESQPIISLLDEAGNVPIESQDVEELKTVSDHVEVEVEVEQEVYAYRTHFTIEKYSFFDQICDFYEHERKKKRIKGVSYY